MSCLEQAGAELDVRKGERAPRAPAEIGSDKQLLLLMKRKGKKKGLGRKVKEESQDKESPDAEKRNMSNDQEIDHLNTRTKRSETRYSSERSKQASNGRTDPGAEVEVETEPSIDIHRRRRRQSKTVAVSTADEGVLEFAARPGRLQGNT